MKNKKIMLSAYIVALISVTILAVVNINKENTSALSPIGVSAEENFEMVSAEFGKDFEKFIQDKAKVKIYEEEDGTLIKVGDVNFKIKNSSELIENLGNKVTNFIENII